MKDTWLRSGYALFARLGPSGLKVEVLAYLLEQRKATAASPGPNR